MPLSYATFTGNSGSPQSTFTIPYDYILKDHIKVYYGRDILANTQTALLVNGTDYNFTSDTTIQLIGSALNSGTTTGNPHNLANGVVLTLERDTPDSSQIVEFADGSNLIGDNLNNANLQNLFVVQEQQDKNDLSAAKSISAENAANTATSNVATLTSTQFKTDGSTPMTGDIDANSNKIKNLSDPTNAQDGVTKAYLERSGSITSTQIADGTIVNADVNASAAIAQSKLDIANATQSAAGYQSAADKTKLDGIETGATADQTDAEIRSLVESASDSNVFTDQDHAKLNGIEAGATADQTDAEIRAAVEAAADSNVFTDNDHSKLNGIEAGATADQTATEIKTLYESNSNTNPLTDAEKAVIDGVTANTSELNKLDGFTGSAADLNEVVTGKNVVEQITGSATDAQIPTAQAVNERVVELVTEVGGFHPIANETSFPTTNPDINDGAGTIVSLKALTNSFSTGAGVTTHTFTNGTGAGNNVLITGLPSNTTFQAGKGLLLETTTTLHEYVYHRLVLDEAGVSNADSLVTAFNEKYYGPLASNPNTRPSGADRQNGDLYFNQSDGKMKVYNGSHASGTWDDVAAPGNFFINTLSSSSNSGGGSATFNGTATRFTLSNPPNDAQQLLVSINGVIQKPNAGTSPSEGFAISGADIIFASAPPSGASFFIITIGSSVNIGTPSNDTVDASKIIDGSIGNAEISNSAAISGSKINPDFGSSDIKTTGNIEARSSSSVIKAGDVPNDNFVQVSQETSSHTVRGFNNQHGDASVIENLQGTTEQHIVLGDTGYLDTNTLFGVSVTEPSGIYTRLSLSGSGNLHVHGNITLLGNVDGVDIAALKVLVDALKLRPRRNLIINGAFNVNQRLADFLNPVTVNAGSNFYGPDRWYGRGESSSAVFTFCQREHNSLFSQGSRFAGRATFTTATTVTTNDVFKIAQRIEGNNVKELMFGGSQAKTVTISFLVRSSSAGTFGGSLMNAAQNRSYPFTFAINSAVTWEYKTITVPGDQTGTWQFDTGVGLEINFDLGSGDGKRATAGSWYNGRAEGASGAIRLAETVNSWFEVTNVQIEMGTEATAYEYCSYSDEFDRCARYFNTRVTERNTNNVIGMGFYYTNTQVRVPLTPYVEMRVTPSVITTDSTNHFRAYQQSTSVNFDTFDSSHMIHKGGLILGASITDNSYAGNAAYIISLYDATTGQGFVSLNAEL